MLLFKYIFHFLIAAANAPNGFPVCARSHWHEQGLSSSLLRSDGQRAGFFQSLAALMSASWHILHPNRTQVCSQRSNAVISAKCPPCTLCASLKLIKLRCNAQDDCGISRCASKTITLSMQFGERAITRAESGG